MLRPTAEVHEMRDEALVREGGGEPPHSMQPYIVNPVQTMPSLRCISSSETPFVSG